MKKLLVEEIVRRLIENQETIKSFGIEKIGVFGSYARNQQTDESDIDIGVSFASGKKSFDSYMELKFYLESLFDRKKVDLVILDSVKKLAKTEILRELKIAS